MRADRPRAAIGDVKSFFKLIHQWSTFIRCSSFVFLENKIKMRLPFRSSVLTIISLVILALALSAQLKQDAPPAASILGFTPSDAVAEHQLESRFQSIPSPEKAREWQRVFTAEPHPAASDRSEEHTSELQSHLNLVCRLLLEKK